MTSGSPLRLALLAPTEDVVTLTHARVNETIQASRESPRGRMIAPLHRSLDDSLHRMFNAMQPGTYVRPHRHLSPPKAESWIVLKGAVLFLTFSEQGKVQKRLTLSATGEQFGVDLIMGVYHTVIALEEDTVLYEVKSGPYRKQDDKTFAPWAPEESSPEAADYLSSLLKNETA